MPFLEKMMHFDEGRGVFDGIFGLSPHDESAGPLLIDYLYEQGKLDKKMFSILPTRRQEELAKITYGSYQKADEEPTFYNGALNEIVAHRIEGSFHWEVQLTQFCLDFDDKDQANCFRPFIHNALTDTGTSMIILYKKDYEDIADAICKFVEM